MSKGIKGGHGGQWGVQGVSVGLMGSRGLPGGLRGSRGRPGGVRVQGGRQSQWCPGRGQGGRPGVPGVKRDVRGVPLSQGSRGESRCPKGS